MRSAPFNQGSTNKPFLGPIATHGDSYWDVPGRTSPGTGALVDAHYYMNNARGYFLNQYDFNFSEQYGHPIDIHAHFFKDYVNAFWNGSYFAFGDGDGDGSAYDPLTSMDVAAHEFTHSVTEKLNGLIY